MTDFEKDIRKKFADHELSIDTEDIWPGIEKILDKNRGNKRFLWWWLLPLLLILMPIAYYLSSDIQYEQSENKNTQSRIFDKTTAVKGKSNTEDPELSGKDIESEGIIELSDTRTNERGTEKDGKTIGANDINIKSAQLKLITDPALTENSDLETSEIQKTASDPESHSIISDTDSPTIPVIIKEAFTAGDEVNPEEIKKIALIDTRFHKLHYETLIPGVHEPGLTEEAKTKTTFGRTGKWDRSLDLALGYAFASKYLKPKDLSFIPYRELRKQTESHLEAISGAITYQFTHETGFFINTGLHYCQIDERFSSADSIYLLKYGEGLVSTTIKPDGTVVENRGSKMIAEQRIWDKNIYNYYFFFDIPLNIGYAGSLKNLNYEISGGISCNISFLKKGQIIGIDNYPVEIDKESGIFRKAGGLSLNSGLKLFIPFRRHLLYMEPNIRYNLSSITTSDYPLHQNYLSYGINVGARIKF